MNHCIFATLFRFAGAGAAEPLVLDRCWEFSTYFVLDFLNFLKMSRILLRGSS